MAQRVFCRLLRESDYLEESTWKVKKIIIAPLPSPAKGARVPGGIDYSAVPNIGGWT